MKIKDVIDILIPSEIYISDKDIKDDELLNFIKNYKGILVNINDITLDDFLSQLKKISAKANGNKKKEQKKDNVISEDIRNYSLEDIEGILINDRNLSKEKILLLAEIRFGIPSGTHKKTRKEELLKIIKNAIDNERTISIISTNASK